MAPNILLCADGAVKNLLTRASEGETRLSLHSTDNGRIAGSVNSQRFIRLDRQASSSGNMALSHAELAVKHSLRCPLRLLSDVKEIVKPQKLNAFTHRTDNDAANFGNT